MDAARRAIGERLQAMGKAHDLLIRNEWISADIRDVVAGAVNAYVGDVGRVSMAGEPVILTSRAALTIAMVLNELCTNAVKYGAWSAKTGFVAISWITEDDELCFRWSEHRLPTTPARKPRTECGCQPVAFIIASIVAPWVIAATRGAACLTL